jgi:hypothetical protein
MRRLDFSAGREEGHMPRIHPVRWAGFASVGAIIAAVLALPIRIDPTAMSADVAVALAKGGGGGGGGAGGGGGGAGGGGGGPGGGHGGGHGAAADGPGHGNSAGHGHGRGDGVGQGHGRGGSAGKDKGQAAASDRGKGSISSALGKLNGAHASPTAMSHANPKSTVGMLASYRDAVQNNTVTTVEQAQEALGKISNKSVSPEVVAAVNDLLGVGPLGEAASP